MKPLGDEVEHYWKLTDMAAATNAGLVAAHQDGRLSQEDWADMLTRCRGCDWSVGCGEWLDKVGQAAVPPALCRNRHRLATLRAGRLAAQPVRSPEHGHRSA